MARRIVNRGFVESKNKSFGGRGGTRELDAATASSDGAERLVDRLSGDYNKCRIASFDIPHTKAGRVWRGYVARKKKAEGPISKGDLALFAAAYAKLDEKRSNRG
jgi:hypothetical protein